MWQSTIKGSPMKKLLLLAIISTFSVGSWADCETNNKNQSDLAACFEKQSYNNVIVNLNKLKELSKEQLSYNPSIIKELNKAQSTWIAYRDSYCDTYSNYHNEMNNHSNCIVSLNNARANQLKEDIEAN